MADIVAKQDVKENFNLGIGTLWLKISLIYFLIMVIFGMVLSMKGNFQFASVHSHIGLMGWVSMALSGIIYCIFPKAGQSKLGYIHFWVFNISLPVMLISLFMYINGRTIFEPILAISSILYILGVICFTLNIFLNLGNPKSN